MSSIVGEYSRVTDAFDRPTLNLLKAHSASLIIAVMRSVFSSERTRITAEQMHAQVDAYLHELETAGQDSTKSSGRALCQSWVRSKWLLRDNGPDGEEYALTSHALEALDIVKTLARERTLISESRLTSIVEAVRRTALEASPSVERNITILEASISELVAERDRLLAGGVITEMSDERMLENVANLHDLIGQLPGDFKRVEESMTEMHRHVMARFRNEERPIGEIVSEYLTNASELVSATPEGRAFSGAFVLLRDEGLLLELRENLEVILEHPAAAVLDSAEAREFLATVNVIRRGTEGVLAQRRKLSATLREHITSHDHKVERELDSVLNSLGRELAIWMNTARARTTVPVALMPESLDIERLYTRFYDPAAARPPAPLEDTSADAPAAVDWDAVRAQGGPAITALRELIEETKAATAAEAFNSLPAGERRPVEILGLVHVIADADRWPGPSAGHEMYDAVRPDGTEVTYRVPRIALATAEPDQSSTGRS